MSGFNKHKVQALFSFFFPQLNLSHPGARSRPARVCLSSFQTSRCLFDSDSSWGAIIRVTVPHVTLIGTAWPLAVDWTDVLVSAADSLTSINRNLVCLLTHLQGAEVQLLFGQCGWKQAVLCCIPSGFGHGEFTQDVVLYRSNVSSLFWILVVQLVKQTDWKHIEEYEKKQLP